MSRVNLIRVVALGFIGAASAASAVAQTNYPWQWHGTTCDRNMTFCWNGPYKDNSDEVEAWGSRWVSEDRAVKPLEWIRAIRCIKPKELCVVARTQMGMTNIDLYPIREWTNDQVTAGEEQKGDCEEETLLINRADASVSLISKPGPLADSSSCKVGGMKPKTVLYRLAR